VALDTTIGGATADSYGTLAEYQAYASAMGWTLAADDAADEVNLRRATVTLDASYRWIGQRQYKAQVLDWPRIWTPLVNGFAVDPDGIPKAIKDAQFEMAYLIQAGVDPFATYDGAIKREKLDVMEREYTGGKGRPAFTGVDRLLQGYKIGGAGQSQMVRG